MTSHCKTLCWIAFLLTLPLAGCGESETQVESTETAASARARANIELVDSRRLERPPREEAAPAEEQASESAAAPTESTSALPSEPPAEAPAEPAVIVSGGCIQSKPGMVYLAQEWLCDYQQPDGSWSYHHPAFQNFESHDVTASTDDLQATGLALLALLGAGQTHMEGDYRQNVHEGLEYLLAHLQVAEERAIFSDGDNPRTHALCTLVISEAYGMTADDAFYEPMVQTVNQILHTQNPTTGGWPAQAGGDDDPASTMWHVLALRSAELNYVFLPPEKLAAAGDYLAALESQVASDQEPGTRPTVTMSLVAGPFRQIFLQDSQDSAELGRDLAALAASKYSETNLATNYFASLVLSTQTSSDEGRQMWDTWYGPYRKSIDDTQAKEGHLTGSWLLAEEQEFHGAGRHYYTCMAMVGLEVYYRHLPIYSIGRE